MADQYISKSKAEKLEQRMTELDIREEDIVEKFILGSGKGGQKVNKTSSCVYIKHKPSGLEVKCQSARSQSLNRFMARRELCEKIAEKIVGEKTLCQAKREKIRRQKRRRSRRQKEKILKEKRLHGDKKKRRMSITEEDGE